MVVKNKIKWCGVYEPQVLGIGWIVTILGRGMTSQLSLYYNNESILWIRIERILKGPEWNGAVCICMRNHVLWGWESEWCWVSSCFILLSLSATHFFLLQLFLLSFFPHHPSSITHHYHLSFLTHPSSYTCLYRQSHLSYLSYFISITSHLEAPWYPSPSARPHFCYSAGASTLHYPP